MRDVATNPLMVRRRFLVGRSLLSFTDEGLAGEFADSLRTTIVQNLSAMTTWVLGRSQFSNWSSPLIAIRRESLIRVKISTDKSACVY